MYEIYKLEEESLKLFREFNSQEEMYVFCNTIIEEVFSVYPENKSYFVSNLARVLSFRIKNKVSFITPYINETNYTIVSLRVDGKNKKERLHRVVAKTFIPNPDFKEQVNHKDLDKNNNKLTNLEWMTGKENSVHAVENKAKNKFNVSRVRLTEKDVHNICEILQSGQYTTAYNVLEQLGLVFLDRTLVTDIKNGKSYKEISCNYKFQEPQLGRVFKGARRSLSDKEVHNICRLLEEGLTVVEIAKQLDLFEDKNKLKIISKIKCGTQFKEISESYKFPDYNTRLDTDTVKCIIESLIENKLNTTEIAEMFSTTNNVVMDIKNKKTWKELTNDIEFSKKRTLTEEEVIMIYKLTQDKDKSYTRVQVLKELNLVGVVTEITVGDIKLRKVYKTILNKHFPIN